MENKTQSPSMRNFVFGHINAESLIAHLLDVQSLVLKFNPLVMGISESFLKPDKDDVLAAIPHYTLLRHDRLNKARGGIAMYVHEAARCRIVGSSDRPVIYQQRPEFILVEIALGKSKVLCVLVYNPPKTGYWADVEDAILSCNSSYDLLVLMGDLNIEWHRHSSSRTILAQSLQTLGLTPVPYQPTFHWNGGSSTLDYICANGAAVPSSIVQTKQPGTSGHDAIFASFPLDAPVIKPCTITRRSFKNFDSVAFSKDLSQIDWSTVYQHPDVDHKVHHYTAALLALYDKHAPLRTFVVRKKPTPWMTVDLKSIIKTRNRAHRNFTRNRSASNRDLYKHLRNRVKLEIRNAKHRYYHAKLSDCRNKREM